MASGRANCSGAGQINGRTVARCHSGWPLKGDRGLVHSASLLRLSLRLGR